MVQILSPAKKSTERNAGASAVINSRNERVLQQRDRQRKRTEKVAKTPSCPGSLG